MIVIYGDHFGIPSYNLDKKDTDNLFSLLNRPYDIVDMFNVPLIIKVPNVSESKTIENVGGEIDIMPTIANLLGVSLEDRIYFGQDILNQSENLLGIRYYLPTGSYIDNNYLFAKNSYSVDISNRKINQNSDKEKEDRIKKLMELSDSYINNLQKLE